MPRYSRLSQSVLPIIFFLFLLSCSSGSSPLPATAPADNTPSGDVPAEEAPPSAEPMPTPPSPPVEVVELPPLPSGDLAKENIGSKTQVHGLFDRWTLKSSIHGGRGSSFAEVTSECYGRMEVDLAVTPEQWKSAEIRRKYYQTVHQLIEKNATQLLIDMDSPLADEERNVFLRAVKALAWQESRWQHFLRYKDWFFVFLSGGSYNVLDDLGITQVARSAYRDYQVRAMNRI